MLLKGNAKSKGVKILISSVESFRLYGDPIKFHQILSNLISNSIDAYDEVSDRSKIIMVKVEKVSTKTVKLTVKDNGVGIKSEDIKHIFEPFYSTKKVSGRGLGLGLANVKQFIEQDFDGKVFVKSKPNKGTEFIIRFHQL